MAEDFDNPCANGLSAECFKQRPAFARQAFAFRMIAAFTPPGLSKPLLKFLGLIRFDPAGQIPEFLNLPPWWIIAPDTVIPPDWEVGDPPFTGLLIPPVFSPSAEASKAGEAFSEDLQNALETSDGISASVSGPDFLAPGGGGSAAAPDYSSPVIDPWFYDAFNSFDLAVWNKWLDGSATIELDGIGNLKFLSTGTDYCNLWTSNDSTIPDKWVFTFRVKLKDITPADPDFFIQIFTGSHVVKLRLNPPTTVWHATGAGSDEITVVDNMQVFHVYSLVYDDGYTDLYQDGVLISSNQHHQHQVANPGQIYFSNSLEMTSWLDYVSLDPN